MTRGGKREGAGRKLVRGIKGKRVQFYLYPDEIQKMREYLKSLRA